MQLYNGEVGRQEDGRPLVERYLDSSCTPGVYVNYLAPEIPPGGSHEVQSPAPAPTSTSAHAEHADEQLHVPLQTARWTAEQEMRSLAQLNAHVDLQALHFPKQTLARSRRQSRSQSPRQIGLQTPATALEPSPEQSAAQPVAQSLGQPSRRVSPQAQTQGNAYCEMPVQEQPVQAPQQSVLLAQGQTWGFSSAPSSCLDPGQTSASLVQSLWSALPQTAVLPHSHNTPQAVTSEQTQARSIHQPVPSIQAVTRVQTDMQAQPKSPTLAFTSNAAKAQALSSPQTPALVQGVTPVQNQARTQVIDSPLSSILPGARGVTQLHVGSQTPHGSDGTASQAPAELSNAPQQFSAPRQASEPPGSTDEDELMLVS